MVWRPCESKESVILHAKAAEREAILFHAARSGYHCPPRKREKEEFCNFLKMEGDICRSAFWARFGNLFSQEKQQSDNNFHLFKI